MAYKILSFLAVVLIILSLVNIKLNFKENAPKEIFIKPSLIVYELKRDIEKGKSLSANDLLAKTVEYDEKYFQEGYVLAANLVEKKISARNLKAKEIITFADLKDPLISKDEQNATGTWLNVNKISPARAAKGYVAFAFDLKSQEFEILKNIKDGEFVDVYIHYSTLGARDKGIAAKQIFKNSSISKESANNETLKWLFKDKKLLSIKRSSKAYKDPQIIATAFIELDTNEAKIAYAAQELGEFVFFPSNDNDQKTYSIKKIFPENFINELRGDK